MEPQRPDGNGGDGPVYAGRASPAQLCAGRRLYLRHQPGQRHARGTYLCTPAQYVDFYGWDSPVAVREIETAEWTEDDLYWLSRIISAESRGESLTGQIAVGNVICNRVDASEFPNTIRGVIFDRKNGVQFEPVSNQTIYNEPSAQSVLAARLVLAGVDAAGDSLYFFNPALSKGSWIRANRPYYTTIGCHMFFR